MQWAGRQIMMNFTVPLAAAGYQFTSWVMENERALVRLQKVYADTVTGVNHFERDIDGLSKAFELLSVRYGIHQSAVREIAGSWAQAGARGAALANGVESTLKTMILGEMDAVEATQALISIQAQWGASSEGLIDIINKINATENNTATTFKGLVEAMSRSASTARSAGVDVDHLLAMITSITPAAGSATQAGNALKTMISRVLSPTKSATEVLGLMGINTADMSWKMLTAAQRLELMAEKYHDLENSADGYISSQAGVVSTEMASRFQINRFDALMRDVYASINDNADANGYYGQTLRVLGEDSNYATAALNEIQTVLESNPRMMERAGVVMRNSFMKAIYNILPQIMMLVNWIASLTEKFANMDPRLQKLLISFAGFLALLGPPIVLLGTLTVAVARLGMFFQGLGWAMGKLKLAREAEGFGRLGEAIGGVRGKIKRFIARLLQMVGISKSSATGVAAAQAAQTEAVAAAQTVQTEAVASAVAAQTSALTAGGEAQLTAVIATEAAKTQAVTAGVNARAISEALGAAAASKAAQASASTVTAYTAATAAAVNRSQAAQTSAVSTGAIARLTTISTAAQRELGIVYAANAAKTRSDLATVTATTSLTSRMVGAASVAWGKILGTTRRASSAIAGTVSKGWTAASTAATVGAHKMMTSSLGPMQAINVNAQRIFSHNLPIAVSSGYGKITGAMYGAHASWTAATQRTFAQNLAAMDFYVNSAIAKAGRMGAGVTAAAQVGATKVQGGAIAAQSFGRGFMSGLQRLGLGVMSFFTGLGPKIVGAIRAIGPMLLRVVTGLGRFVFGPLGMIITTALTLLWGFRDQIKQVFINIGKQFSDITTPFGKAWMGVVDIFKQGLDLLRRMFGMLPESVQNVLRSVVDMVKRAALAVYSLFSYINPFARHSPSLVENVTAGMQIVGDQFGLAARVIRAHMSSAYGSLRRFGAATANFMKRVTDMRSAEERATIGRVAPGAVGTYDALNRQLPILRADLDSVSSAMLRQEKIVTRLKFQLDAQQRVVDGLQKTYDKLRSAADKISEAMSDAQEKLSEYANMGITGQREMSDAIFENEMAQKRLRLEILRLEEAHGTVDDLRSRMASLRGDIEYLQGRAKDLRAQGAGSDILGPIEAQIAAMEAEYKALAQGSEGAAGPISDLEKQLQELQKQGEILDLEEAIKYDPMIRQIDQLADSYEELPFSKIIAGIRDQQRELAKLEPQYQRANAEVERQRAALEAAQGQLESVNDKFEAQDLILSGLKDVYSAVETQIRNIEDAIREVVSAAGEMERALEAAARKGAGAGAGSAANALSPGAQNFLDAAGGFFEDPGEFNIIADEAGDIDEWIDEFLEKSGTIFEGISIFQPIKDAWQGFKDWWGENVNPIFANLGQGIVDIFSGIDWGAPFVSLWEWLGGLWDRVAEFFTGENAFTEAMSDLYNKIVEPFEGIAEAIAEPWESVKESFWELVESLTNLWEELRDDFQFIWESLKVTFSELGEAFEGIKVALEPLWPYIKGIGELLLVIAGIAGGALVAALIVLANVIAQVITPVFEMIAGIISGLLQILSGVIDFVVGIFTGDWERAWEGVKGIFVGIWDTVVAVLWGPVDLILGIMQGLVDGLVAAWEWVYNILVGNSIIPDMVNEIFGWFTDMKDWVMDKVDALVDLIVGGFEWLYDHTIGPVIELVESVTGWFGDMKDSAVEKAGELWDGVTGWFGDMKDGVFERVGEIKDNVVEGFLDMKDGAVEKASELWDGVTGWFGDTKDGALESVTELADNAVERYDEMKETMERGAEILKGRVTDWFEEKKDGVVSSAKEARDNVTKWYGDMKGSVESRVRELKDKITGWFREKKDGAISRAREMKDSVVSRYGEMKTNALSRARELKDNALSRLSEMRDGAVERARKMRDNVGNAFNTLRDNGSKAWNALKDNMGFAVNGIIRGINKLIDGLNKVTNILPGVDWTIPKIGLLPEGGKVPKFARGGMLPARADEGFITNGPRAIVGEGRQQYPEFVIPTDPQYRTRALGLYSQLGNQLRTTDMRQGMGGPIDTIKGAIGKGSDLLKGGVDWLENIARGAVTTILKPFKNMAQERINAIQWRWGRNIANAGLSKVWDWATNADEAYRRAGKEVENMEGYTGPSGPWTRPMSGYSITSHYGPRSLFGNIFHSGIDLAGPAGSAIRAASTGRVVRAGWNAVGGRSGIGAAIAHAKGEHTYYGHMSSLAVKLGQIVKAGQRIGTQGATGNVTGPHLHFETHRGRLGIAVNPLGFMRAKGVPLAKGGIVKATPGGTYANIGEGRYDEAVIPLPYGWRQAMASMGDMRSLRGPVITQIEAMTVNGAIKAREVIVEGKGAVEHKEINFYGDLSFPNVEDGDDAEALIRNLEDLAGGR